MVVTVEESLITIELRAGPSLLQCCSLLVFFVEVQFADLHSWGGDGRWSASY